MSPRLLVVLFILALLLAVSISAAACGGDGGIPKPSPPTTEETPTAEPTQITIEAPTTTPTTTPTELAYEEFVSPRAGYRIETPEEWITAEDFPIEFGGESFLADFFFVPVPEQGFSASVNVLDSPTLGATFDQIIVLERAAIRESSEDIREDDLVIAGHEAKIIHSTSEEAGELLDFSQVFVVIDDTAWVLTLTTLPGDRDRYLPIFEHMYNSFRP
jgi:hypothetical protein